MKSLARICFTVLLVFLAYRYSGFGSKPFDEITWQGEKYKLSRSFRDWEDYKKAGDQLAASEASRVLAKVKSIPVPAKAPNISELINKMPALNFPGYGHGFDGSVHDTDGNRYQFSEYVIPLAEKRRALLYREEKDGSFTLVLDEIFENRADERTAEYQMNRKRVVEEGKLRVYVNGRLHREASLRSAT